MTGIKKTGRDRRKPADRTRDGVKAALKESEKRFRQLVEGIEDCAIVMTDIRGRINTWNAGAERLLGYDTSKILGRNHSIFYLPEDVDRKKPQAILVSARERGRSEEETWLLKEDGSRFWANRIITALKGTGKKQAGFSMMIRDLTKQKRCEDQLQQQGDDLRALARHLQSVREEERIRIARELHDELGQVLTALRMDLSILNNKICRMADDEHRRGLIEKVKSMAQLVETTIRSVRKIVSELRPAVLDEFGLMTAIQWEAQNFEERTGIRCRVSRLQRDIHVQPNPATAFFRILQEALTNVARHAHAKAVKVTFELKEKDMVLTVKDNGSGIEQTRISGRTSFGLLGMEERARILGGSVSVQGVAGEGTTVVVRIPVVGS